MFSRALALALSPVLAADVDIASPPPLSAVTVLGASGFSSSLNGEYARMESSHDGRAYFQKRGGSKHLFYNAHRRAWWIARQPSRSGGVFASCPGSDVDDPTSLAVPWSIRSKSEPSLQVIASLPPRFLLVTAEGQRGDRLAGTYRLLGTEWRPASGLESTSIAPAYRRVNFATEDGSAAACCLHVGADAEDSGNPGGDVLLTFDGNVWAFSLWDTMPRPHQTRRDGAEGGGNRPETRHTLLPRVLAECSEHILRPDFLTDVCYSGHGIRIRARPAEAPFVVDVLLDAATSSFAGRAQGEYHRSSGHDGRAAFSKLDGSMHLFYSDDLGGWHFSERLGASGYLSNGNVHVLRPDRLRGSWQALDATHGTLSEVTLRIKGRTSPPWILLGSWPAELQALGGEYALEARKCSGRPVYSRQSVHGPNASVRVFYAEGAGEWRVSQGYRRLAVGISPSAYSPDRVQEWHLVGDDSCAAFPAALAATVSQPGPGAIVVHGRRKDFNSLINGEYVRAPQDLHGRPAYSKHGHAQHIFYSQVHLGWRISSTLDDGSALLAFCPDPRARDPTLLSKAWVFGVTADANVRIEELPPATILRLDSAGDWLDAEFQLLGERQGRPVYQLRRTFSEATWLVGQRPPVLRFNALEASWVLVDRELVMARARVADVDAYRPAQVSGPWEVARMGPRSSPRLVNLTIRQVVDGADRIRVKTGGDAAPVAEGDYARELEDVDGRPAYRAASSLGSPSEGILLAYNNTLGAWMFTAAGPEASGRTLAICFDAYALRPEIARGSWQVMNVTRFVEAELLIEALAQTSWGRWASEVVGGALAMR